ncbi:MAG TPA: hypothetical protein VHP11_09520 [Tepidisphaeraceae bacterium]|nr:hypothetical protein [Tepidisphaeraceae bacterium]
MRRTLLCIVSLGLMAGVCVGGPVDRRLIEQDWAAQDQLYGPQGLRPEAIAGVIREAGVASLQAQFKQLQDAGVASDDSRWLELYRHACTKRRENRLRPILSKIAKVVFAKHYDLGGSHYAYTEGLSDAADERSFVPGASLCLLEMDGIFGETRTLIDDRNGVIRDPDVSYDGKRILFSWKKSDREDDYHLYEMTVEDGKIRAITSGLGFADYEGQYLPNGDLVFSSTRCVQSVDCWWTEVSNLYTCAADGKYLRRLAFDQVHTNFPTVMSDGRVIYTRWEYNDRGQIFPQGLFQMYPDGTGQTEYYGNNSWFPTAILHARGLPGSDRIVCILSGHHTIQKGWLAIIDPARGRQENSGTQLIAPVRETPAERIDAYGQEGDQFQYPWPLSEKEFLVTFKPAGSDVPFGIYFMTIDGRRELLAADPEISCNQPIPLAARPTPPARPSGVDYRQKTGTFYMQDVYVGPGLAGVPRGTIKSLRVVALEYRAAAIGSNGNRGPAGDALVSTPVSIEGTWDVKVVLGTAKVHEDGSASFTVPSNTPVYFQAMDANNHAVQTMRSWAQLQPGETMSCVGCHEDKNSAPPAKKMTLALKAGPQPLTPWYGPARGFSFQKEIQPILDRQCVRCHFEEKRPTASGGLAKKSPGVKPAFSLKGRPGTWSPAYLALANRQVSNWISPQSEPSMLPPYHAGAAKSRLIALLKAGHYEVKLSGEEMDRLACWIDLLVPCFGDYTEGLSPQERERYNRLLAKRNRWLEEERRNIEQFIRDRGR